ncbi:MAG: stage II sporulation protein M [Nanoarchaeota archaeon]
MLEMLMNPRKAERHPWELFFIGAVYASISLAIVELVFAKDAVLSRYSGILVVTFTVMFSIPFIYYTIKLEEKKINSTIGTWALLLEHRKAIEAFMFLFLGFVIAFSFFYTVLPSNQSFKAQIETYCVINRPSSFTDCVQQYGIKDTISTTGAVTGTERLFKIFWNNFNVCIFTLVFSLIFGAGVIFILAWNASVIAAAIGIFTKSNLSDLPTGLMRYMIHGVPEIASYFLIALAGGLISISVIRHEAGTEKFWEVLRDSINLVIISLVILFIAALIEVYITPKLF